MIAVMLPVMLGIAAMVVDLGHAFVVKRHLQNSADSAALAAAFELDGVIGWDTRATNVANLYSGSTGGHNLNPGLPSVTTTVSFPTPTGAKVKVLQTARSGVFFGGLIPGFDGFDVSAYAVASRQATTGGTPLAVYVHEVCGGGAPSPPGNKGFHAAGDNVLIQGAIHANGQFKVSNPGFVSELRTTVFRPPNAASLPIPGGVSQGTCDGSGDPKITNYTSLPGRAQYCTLGGCPGSPNTPAHGVWQNWATAGRFDTPHQVLQKVTGMSCGSSYAYDNPCCTIQQSSDWTLGNNTNFAGGVICLPLDKKFTLDGTVTGPGGTHAPMTVIAGEFVINTKPGTKIKPYSDAEPVLFYSWKTNGEININSSGALDWIGYAINRKGGINVNSDGVVSPREGMLEAEWIVINAPNFRMEGSGPPSVGGTGLGGVLLEE